MAALEGAVDREEILVRIVWSGRRLIGASLVILFLCFLTLIVYLKRYVGGLVVIRPRSLHIGSLAQAMMRVSASLFVGSRKRGR